MNTEQLTQLTNIKIENILERYIIYLKDRFNEVNHKDSFNCKDNKEFDYEYVEDNQPRYEDTELYNYTLTNACDKKKYLTFLNYRKENYIYFKELVIDNFENLCDDDCYKYNIHNIVEEYRGQTDDEYFENNEYILNEIDSEDEEEINYDNWESNNRYKFFENIEGYFEILLDEDYELNKIDFVKSIIDSLNNLVFLK